MSFASNRSALSYRHLSAETSLVDADPHRVITLLFQASLEAINRARHALATHDVPARGKAISTAIRIIHEGLQASLDMSAGEIAANLSALYDYMCARLLAANRSADDTMLQEVAALLQELSAGWSGIGPAARGGVGPAARAAAVARAA